MCSLRFKSFPVVSPEKIYIWQINTRVNEATYGSLKALLSSEEQERSDRFAFDKDRFAFVVANGVARLLLERFTGIAVASQRFEKNAFGKPSLVGSEWDFNISHSGSLALCGLCQNCPIGVDVEQAKANFNPIELSEHYFSKSEKTILQETVKSKRLEAFYRCWTRKEAYIKAIGKGLSEPLDSLSVPIWGDEPGAVDIEEHPLDGAQYSFGKDGERKYTIHPLDVEQVGYYAAVAYPGRVKEVLFRVWEND